MSTTSNNDSDCKKSGNNGNEITSAISKDQLCRNFTNIVDSMGASVNVKDSVTGATPLHCAIHFGCIDCAVILIYHGANIGILDNNWMSPFQLIHKFRDLNNSKIIGQDNELMVWGLNKNDNIGITIQSTQNPQFIDIFRKQQIDIKSMSISSLHSLFLDKNGKVYSVGHGNGGRLGTGTDNSLSTPKRISLPFEIYNHAKAKIEQEYVIGISCSRYHSLILTNKNSIYACGFNNDNQLGIRGVSKLYLLSFHDIGITEKEKIRHIIAKDHFSLAITDTKLYVWGKNLGQFNSTLYDHYIMPKVAFQTFQHKITKVEASNSSIAIVLGNKQINLFHNYKMRILKHPMIEEINTICISEREIDSRSKNNSLSLPKNIKLLFVSKTDIYIYYSTLNTTFRCVTSSINLTKIDKILFKNDQILFITNGDLYQGKTIKIPIPSDDNIPKDKQHHQQPQQQQNNDELWDVAVSSNNKFLNISKTHQIKFDFTYFPSLDRVINIFCNDEFESFGAIQENSRKYFQLPKFKKNDRTFKKLYDKIYEENNYDIIIYINNEEFYAHKFVIFLRSETLKILIENEEYEQKQQEKKQKQKTNNIYNFYFNEKNLTGKMFNIMLKHIYYNYYLTQSDLLDICESLGSPYSLKSKSNMRNAAVIFLEILEKYDLFDLALYLRGYIDGKINLGDPPEKNADSYVFVNRILFPSLYDVKIKCGKSGKQEIKAHKCILTTRSEYFKMMFDNEWSENKSNNIIKTVNLETIEYENLSLILDYMYSLNERKFIGESHISDTFLYKMMMTCNRLLYKDLCNVCEILLLDRISIRKCGEMLQFSQTHNCEILQKYCLDFICQNLQRVLFSKTLETCDYDTLSKINIHYHNLYENLFEQNCNTNEQYSIDMNTDKFIKFMTDNIPNINLYESDDHNEAIANTSSGNLSILIPKLNRNKNRPNKSAQLKRDYEKKGIDSIKKSLTFDENEKIDNKNNNENNDLSNNNNNQHQIWTKVHDKKDNKNKPLSLQNPNKSPTSSGLPGFVSGSINCNNILKEENLQQQQTKNDFISLNELLKNSDKQQEQKQQQQQTRQPLSFNLSDLTVNCKTEKISQKQRKRLLSETSQSLPVSIQLDRLCDSTPIKKKIDNNTEISSTSFAEIMKSPTTKQQQSSTCIKYFKNNLQNEIPLSPSSPPSTSSTLSSPPPLSSLLSPSKISTSTGAISKNSSNKFQLKRSKDNSTPPRPPPTTTAATTFSQIIKEEKKQKEYYEQQKNKPFALTQIEDSAISELNAFYNVDDVVDEDIKIDRKVDKKPNTMNFNVWCNKNNEN